MNDPTPAYSMNEVSEIVSKAVAAYDSATRERFDALKPFLAADDASYFNEIATPHSFETLAKIAKRFAVPPRPILHDHETWEADEAFMECIEAALGNDGKRLALAVKAVNDLPSIYHETFLKRTRILASRLERKVHYIALKPVAERFPLRRSAERELDRLIKRNRLDRHSVEITLWIIDRTESTQTPPSNLVPLTPKEIAATAIPEGWNELESGRDDRLLEAFVNVGAVTKEGAKPRSRIASEAGDVLDKFRRAFRRFGKWSLYQSRGRGQNASVFLSPLGLRLASERGFASQPPEAK